MSAAKALEVALAAGIDLRLDGDDLVLEADAPAPSEIIDLLSRNKREIVALLRPGLGEGSAEGWRAFFAHRQAVAELECGLPRAEAQARAFECCVVEWMNHNPERSPPGQCLACGNDYFHEAVLPFGVEPAGQVWLHSGCWSAWYDGRKANAVAALEALGIVGPREFPK